MILTLTKLNTQILFEHEKLFTSLTPETINNSLTAALVYDSAEEKSYIRMKDSLAELSLELESEIVASDKENLAIFFEFSKLMYVLRSYSPEDLSDLKIIVSRDKVKETSSFLITCVKDKLSLPHMVMTKAQEEDYFFLEVEIPKIVSTDFDINWSLFTPQEKRDFSVGLTSSSLFLDTDEKKNNAVAIYSNKLVSNDIKHVFEYRLDFNIHKDASAWVPLHKKIVKIIVALLATAELKQFLVNSKVVYFNTSNAFCKMNNSVSNIAPPNTDDLKSISSLNLITALNVETIKNTSNFFSGFYSNSSMNPLKLEFTKDKIKCVLQDSGLADFGSCNIERDIPSDNTTECTFTIVNDSLKAFLSRVSPEEENIQIYGEDIKPAVKITTKKMDIYLARLK
jgi:hypothetical protein